MTGFGRLGHFFSSEKVFGVVPDIITCAKGITSGYLPLGAVLFSDKLISDLKHDSSLFFHGYTYSGHPACCAAALKNIEILKRDKILEHVREIEPYFFDKLNNWAQQEGQPGLGYIIFSDNDCKCLEDVPEATII